MSEQENEPDKRCGKRRFAWPQITAWTVVGLLLYVLSFGPASVVFYVVANWAMPAGYLPFAVNELNTAFEVAYAPLFWLARHSEVAGEAIFGYLRWCYKLIGVDYPANDQLRQSGLLK